MGYFLANQKFEQADNLYGAQNYTGAIRLYTEGIQLNPNNVAAYYNRGLAYSNLNQYEQAISDFSKAIALKPDFAEAYYNRGVIYDRLRGFAWEVEVKHKEQAVQDFSKAIELNPNFAEAYRARAGIYLTFSLADDALLEKAKADAAKANELSYNG